MRCGWRRRSVLAALAAAPAAVVREAPVRVRLLLTGDVMTGRGIDQILPHSGDPVLFEPFVRDARTYVELAEAKNGPIPKPVPFDRVWGEAEAAVAALAPDVRIVNLETAITADGTPWPKGINYRMHPDNVEVLRAFSVDCCVLANNHVMDWGGRGLLETLETLRRAGIAFCGAGSDAEEAEAPAVLRRAGRPRVLVFAAGHPSSGIPPEWAAGPGRPGVNLLEDLGERDLARLWDLLARFAREGDLPVLSVHVGPNWGYEIDPPAFADFARAAVAELGFCAVHAHSSHHPKGVEIRDGRPILWGCGDFLNDYEGIEGYEAYRDDLVVAWLPAFEGGRLADFTALPFRIRRMRLEVPDEADLAWLEARLARECARFGTRLFREGTRLRLVPAT